MYPAFFAGRVGRGTKARGDALAESHWSFGPDLWRGWGQVSRRRFSRDTAWCFRALRNHRCGNPAWGASLLERWSAGSLRVSRGGVAAAGDCTHAEKV